MNRREFTALIGAGTLFPAKFLKGLAAPQRAGSLEGLDDDHAPSCWAQCHYVYYVANDNVDVYRLWFPGCVLGVPADNPLNYFTAFRQSWTSVAPDHSPATLFTDDYFAQPFTGCGDFWYHHFKVPYPLTVLEIDDAERFEANGCLKRCKPFCSFKEWVRRDNKVKAKTFRLNFSPLRI